MEYGWKKCPRIRCCFFFLFERSSVGSWIRPNNNIQPQKKHWISNANYDGRRFVVAAVGLYAYKECRFKRTRWTIVNGIVGLCFTSKIWQVNVQRCDGVWVWCVCARVSCQMFWYGLCLGTLDILFNVRRIHGHFFSIAPRGVAYLDFLFSIRNTFSLLFSFFFNSLNATGFENWMCITRMIVIRANRIEHVQNVYIFSRILKRRDETRHRFICAWDQRLCLWNWRKKFLVSNGATVSHTVLWCAASMDFMRVKCIVHTGPSWDSHSPSN